MARRRRESEAAPGGSATRRGSLHDVVTAALQERAEAARAEEEMQRLRGSAAKVIELKREIVKQGDKIQMLDSIAEEKMHECARLLREMKELGKAVEFEKQARTEAMEESAAREAKARREHQAEVCRIKKQLQQVSRIAHEQLALEAKLEQERRDNTALRAEMAKARERSEAVEMGLKWALKEERKKSSQTFDKVVEERVEEELALEFGRSVHANHLLRRAIDTQDLQVRVLANDCDTLRKEVTGLKRLLAIERENTRRAAAEAAQLRASLDIRAERPATVDMGCPIPPKPQQPKSPKALVAKRRVVTRYRSPRAQARVLRDREGENRFFP